MDTVRRFIRDEEGANLVEYALLVSFIAIVVIVGAQLLGNNLNTWFNNLGTAVGVWAHQVP